MIRNLNDLANATGLSKSTVSRALAGNLVVSATTRARVTALASASDFQINQTARNLRLKRAQAIGVVLPMGHEIGQHLSDPFFITMLAHLADALTERGYDVLLSRVIPTDDGWLDRLVASGRTDGVIIIGQSDQTAVIDRVAARFLPIVVWGANLPGQRHCSVGTDNYLGGAMAARHLVGNGRQRLVFYGNPDAPEIGQRHRGFADAVAAAGVNGRLLSVRMAAEAAFAAIADDLALQPVPDGIVAASDTIAMMAIRALAERRLRVPEDVAIVGYDDVVLAAHTTPPLTTIRQDLTRGAALLVELLFRRMAGEAARSIVLPPELIVRASSIVQADAGRSTATRHVAAPASVTTPASINSPRGSPPSNGP